MRNVIPGQRYPLAKMPQFHVYTTTIYEVVASNIIESTENTKSLELAGSAIRGTPSPYAGNPFSDASFKLETGTDKQLDSGVDCRRSNYSYYLKNFIIYIVSATLQYSVANGTLNLLTSLAGEEKGFATLVVTYISSYMAILAPGLIKSLGCKAVIVIVNIGYLVFSIGSFKVEYYTLIPAAVFGGYSVGTVWICGATYLNILGVSYAQTHRTTANKMISYTNGISTFCFSSGILIGNIISSLLLLPTRDNEAAMTTNTTEECSLEPENLSENKFVYIFRSTMVCMSIVGLILSIFFLDNLKEEKIEPFRLLSLLTNVKNSLKKTGKAWCHPNIGLVSPLFIAGGIGIAFFEGTFSRVST